MSDAIRVFNGVLSLLVAIGMMGCGRETIPPALQSRLASSGGGGEAVRTAHYASASPRAGGESTRSAQSVSAPALQGDVLRVRTDRLRNRLWVLRLDDLSVYDLIDRRLIRRIVLPAWSVARSVCMPDMALDRSGSAIVASNAQPTLFRIDATSFELQQHEIRLRGREAWEIGFGALAFDSDNGLYAMVASGNSLWRIDIATASAALIESYDPPLQHCAVATYS